MDEKPRLCTLILDRGCRQIAAATRVAQHKLEQAVGKQAAPGLFQQCDELMMAFKTTILQLDNSSLVLPRPAATHKFDESSILGGEGCEPQFDTSTGHSDPSSLGDSSDVPPKHGPDPEDERSDADRLVAS